MVTGAIVDILSGGQHTLDARRKCHYLKLKWHPLKEG